jgi:hypothetical protein
VKVSRSSELFGRWSGFANEHFSTIAQISSINNLGFDDLGGHGKQISAIETM